VAGAVEDVWLDHPVNILTSFHYFAKANIGSMARSGLRIIGDSGAYSAASQNTTIDRDEFYEWATKWKSDLLWVAGLDVIGDDKGTWNNWLSAPKHLGLVPTVHYGVPGSAIDKYVEAGADLIGLGGMVPLKSEPDRLLRWCLQMMRYARDKHPHVRFHGWGVTHPQLVMNLPWWSVDSSGFTSAYRFGRMTLVDPSTGKKTTVAMDGRSMAAHTKLLRDHYGIEWHRVAESKPSNRRDVVRVSARGSQHLQTFLRKRFNVTPPKSIVGGVDQGPNVHLVDTGMPNINALMGPNVHFVEVAQQRLAMLTGPSVHGAIVNIKKEAEYLMEDQK
jgi:hypothetical protein